jgi:hypothetical protein
MGVLFEAFISNAVKKASQRINYCIVVCVLVLDGKKYVPYSGGIVLDLGVCNIKLS